MRERETGYFPALTGLRGVAAWWVVLYHFSDPLIGVVPIWMLVFVEHGYLAVDLFFVLSGYVIYITSGRSLEVPGRWVIQRFLLNRLIRIYPLHIFVMVIYLVNPLALWIFSDSGIVGDRYGWNYYIASIFLVQNWGWFKYLQWNVPAWSISAEFAAYITCPLLIYITTFRARVGVFWVASLLGVLAVAIGVVFEVAGERSIGGGIPSLGVVRCVLEFWIGICVGGICRNMNGMSGVRLFMHSVLIFVLIAAFVMLLGDGVRDYWLAPLFFASLIYLLSSGDALFSRILSINGIHYIGLISYSTYLIHYFIKDWVKFLSSAIGLTQFFAYLVLCLLTSVGLFWCVEDPARRVLRKRLMGAK